MARTPDPGDLYAYPAAVVSEASITRLSREAGREVDGRRFGLLLTVAGCEPHEEDTWQGQEIRVGGAVLAVNGPVDRCAATTRHPETGERDLDTLRLITDHGGRAADGSICFGMLAGVGRPGRVRVGDAVEPL